MHTPAHTHMHVWVHMYCEFGHILVHSDDQNMWQLPRKRPICYSIILWWFRYPLSQTMSTTALQISLEGEWSHKRYIYPKGFINRLLHESSCQRLLSLNISWSCLSFKSAVLFIDILCSFILLYLALNYNISWWHLCSKYRVHLLFPVTSRA